jgi:hypothetical protein
MMSQVIEKLKEVAKGGSQPIGFRATRAATTRAQMLLIASLTGIENATPGSIAGADAALLCITKPAPVASFFQRVNKSIREVPWGCQITDNGKKQMERLVGNGCDFVIFPVESAVFAEDVGDKLGKILQIEPGLGDSLVRAINDLPVEAVLAVSAGGYFLNWQHLLSLQRLAAILRKPLLATAPLDVKTGELKALWEAGVDGVILVGDEPSGNLQKLRGEVEKFTWAARRSGKADVLLPHIAGKEAVEAEEEEEDEE